MGWVYIQTSMPRHGGVKCARLAEQVGAETFRLCRQLVDGVLLVDNAATSAAIRDIFNETRTILEPAGAVAVAGAKAYLKRHNLKVSTGACVDMPALWPVLP